MQNTHTDTHWPILSHWPIRDRCWRCHITANVISSLPLGVITEQTRGPQGCRVLEAADAARSETPGSRHISSLKYHLHLQRLLQNITSPSGRRLFFLGPQTQISHPTLCVSAANWVFRRESFSSKQQLVTCQSSCWRRRKARAPKVQLSQNRNTVRHDGTHTFCSLVSCLFTVRSARRVQD